MGEVLYESREYERAASQLRQTLSLDSTFAEAHRVLGQNYDQMQQHDKAIAEFKEALAFSGGSPQCAALLGRAYARSGQRRPAQQLLRGLTLQAQHSYVAPDDLSRLYVSLGDKDNAFRLLEVAYEQHIPSMVNLNVDPTLDDLRPDPRFQQLLRRVGFPP
jgi:Flp pilus assembly protein TadD